MAVDPQITVELALQSPQVVGCIPPGERHVPSAAGGRQGCIWVRSATQRLLVRGVRLARLAATKTRERRDVEEAVAALKSERKCKYLRWESSEG